MKYKREVAKFLSGLMVGKLGQEVGKLFTGS